MFNYIDANGNVKTAKAVIHGILGLVLLIVVLSNLPFTIVEAGERGVVAKFGKVQDIVFNEGLHFINPIGTDVHKMDIRVQKEEVTASAASKDLQTVTSKIAVVYRLDEGHVVQIFRQVRREYSNRYIAPNIQEAVKAATSKYTAEELVTKREIVRDDIKQNFTEKLNGTGLIIDSISIIDFDFSPQFNAAIEAKVTAEQRAKEAENKLKQVEAEAKQSVAKAQAEAESIRLQSAAANNDKYVQLKQLEVQQEFARRWDGRLPQNLYGSAPIPFLDLGR